MDPLGKIKLELLEILGSSLLQSLLENYQACTFLTEVQIKVYLKNKEKKQIYNFEK